MVSNSNNTKWWGSNTEKNAGTQPLRKKMIILNVYNRKIIVVHTLATQNDVSKN